MSLVKWNPESSLFPTFPNWITDFFPGDGFKALNAVSIPAVNIVETKDEFRLKVAAPGFKKEEFKLEIENGFLMVSGEKKEEKEEKSERYTRQEFSYEKFDRSFSLPENVKGDAIKAEYLDGILNVILPKKKTEEKPKVQISVK